MGSLLPSLDCKLTVDASMHVFFNLVPEFFPSYLTYKFLSDGVGQYTSGCVSFTTIITLLRHYWARNTIMFSMLINIDSGQRHSCTEMLTSNSTFIRHPIFLVFVHGANLTSLLCSSLAVLYISGSAVYGSRQ